MNFRKKGLSGTENAAAMLDKLLSLNLLECEAHRTIVADVVGNFVFTTYIVSGKTIEANARSVQASFVPFFVGIVRGF